MDFRISDTFMASVTRLTADEQKAVNGTVVELWLNPAKPGLQFHKLDRAREVVPLQPRLSAITDPADLEDVYDTERHLLYVACTRARDRLFVSGVRPRSEFLEDLGG